ncbi:hypothetical protein KP509_36G030000 [Ceratopteris richardii]|uniref:Uncharacterized protein n=1 Tax=Ceratopteris richardii TaxID=49495 RepID=A0A8T2QBN3_CERRI|nr:hypothetical protein KP509_36G030000 [Ceratopteris richardii]
MQAQSSLLHLATRVFEQLQLAPDTSVLQTITVAFPDKKFDVLCLSCHTYAESSEVRHMVSDSVKNMYVRWFSCMSDIRTGRSRMMMMMTDLFCNFFDDYNMHYHLRASVKAVLVP